MCSNYGDGRMAPTKRCAFHDLCLSYGIGRRCGLSRSTSVLPQFKNMTGNPKLPPGVSGRSVGLGTCPGSVPACWPVSSKGPQWPRLGLIDGWQNMYGWNTTHTPSSLHLSLSWDWFCFTSHDRSRGPLQHPGIWGWRRRWTRHTNVCTCRWSNIHPWTLVHVMTGTE